MAAAARVPVRTVRGGVDWPPAAAPDVAALCTRRLARDLPLTDGAGQPWARRVHALVLQLVTPAR